MDYKNTSVEMTTHLIVLAVAGAIIAGVIILMNLFPKDRAENCMLTDTELSVYFDRLFFEKGKNRKIAAIALDERDGYEYIYYVRADLNDVSSATDYYLCRIPLKSNSNSEEYEFLLGSVPYEKQTDRDIFMKSNNGGILYFVANNFRFADSFHDEQSGGSVVLFKIDTNHPEYFINQVESVSEQSQMRKRGIIYKMNVGKYGSLCTDCQIDANGIFFVALIDDTKSEAEILGVDPALADGYQVFFRREFSTDDAAAAAAAADTKSAPHAAAGEKSEIHPLLLLREDLKLIVVSKINTDVWIQLLSTKTSETNQVLLSKYLPNSANYGKFSIASGEGDKILFIASYLKEVEPNTKSEAKNKSAEENLDCVCLRFVYIDQFDEKNCEAVEEVNEGTGEDTGSYRAVSFLVNLSHLRTIKKKTDDSYPALLVNSKMLKELRVIMSGSGYVEKLDGSYEDLGTTFPGIGARILKVHSGLTLDNPQILMNKSFLLNDEIYTKSINLSEEPVYVSAVESSRCNLYIAVNITKNGCSAYRIIAVDPS